MFSPIPHAEGWEVCVVWGYGGDRTCKGNARDVLRGEGVREARGRGEASRGGGGGGGWGWISSNLCRVEGISYALDWTARISYALDWTARTALTRRVTFWQAGDCVCVCVCGEGRR
jgi:hypothetical protein